MEFKSEDEIKTFSEEEKPKKHHVVECLVHKYRRKNAAKAHTLTPKHLKTGFALHSLTSLELAIQAAREVPKYCKCIECAGEEEMSSRSDSTQTSTLAGTSSYDRLEAKKKLSYLMGLSDGGEEEAGGDKELGEAISDDKINGGSEVMRKAQKYLRNHKIFELFQFIIAHMLAASPFDPISFIINLLDKCLTYRAGISEPPLLYGKRHIDCLFNLMDRMRTGFIDTSQYKTGMLTLGIKSYSITPPTNVDGRVPKPFFVEEAHECLKDLLNDMIRKRSKAVKKSKKIPKAPPPSTARVPPP